MHIGRFIFHMILAVIFACTAIIGPLIIDWLLIGLLAIVEIMAVLLLFVPFAGTFLFRITGIEGLADGDYVDVYLADGWLHKIITFLIINAIAGGIVGLVFSIPEGIRIILGLTLILFMITLSLKIDNAKNDYGDAQNLFSDFLPTILGFGIGAHVIFTYTAMPTFVGTIILCVTVGVFILRNVLALVRW